MRARKNPPPFTLENLLREMKPGRGYSPEAIALMFGVSVEAARGRLLGAVMLGEIRESVARRGIRAAFWVPVSEPTSFASRRVGPLERTHGILTGYSAALWRLHDLCMASRGQPELMRYPPISKAVCKQVRTLDPLGEIEPEIGRTSENEVQRTTQRQKNICAGRHLQIAASLCEIDRLANAVAKMDMRHSVIATAIA